MARWYDSEIGHFIQTDTVIPRSLQTTQAWDRYGYVLNNPVNHNDPTGHCDDGDSLFECLFENINKNVRYWNGSSGRRGYCYEGTTYSDCYGGGDLLLLESNQQIDENELIQLEEDVVSVLVNLKDGSDIFPRGANDLNNPDQFNEIIGDLLAGRNVFDTPFFNGKLEDSNVIYNGIAYKRNDVNYFAQGMWGARFGNSLEEVINISAEWKSRQYGEELSEGAVFWITKGYKDYIQFEQNMNIMFE